MGLQDLLCGCFAIPKANGDVQAQNPQELPAEVVNNAANSSKQELLPVEEGGAPCDGCLANDSANSFASKRASKSRMNPGGDYRYGLSYVRAPLSSRALVGGVEYDSFFVNPLAEGSHEGGLPINYAGATLGVGMGHNNPLAAEYGIGSSATSSPTSSVPGSPAQVKLRSMAPPRAGGACCDLEEDGSCLTAPGTPLQGGMSVKVICVDVASGLSCSEHSGGLPSLPTDATPCCFEAEEGEEVRRLQSDDACSTAAASRSDSSHSLLSDTTTPSPSPWGAGGRSSGGGGGGDFDCSAKMPVRNCCGAAAAATASTCNSCCGGSGGGAVDATAPGTPCDADPLQLPTAPSLSAPSSELPLQLPTTPLLHAEPVKRRLGSDTGALPEQREEEEDGAAAGGSADSAAFAPCTPPLAVRDAGGAAGVGSHGGREPSRAPQGKVRSDGGECGEKLLPELRSTSSAPPPPPPSRLDGQWVEGRRLEEALLEVRSVPVEGSEGMAQPQPTDGGVSSDEARRLWTETSVPPLVGVVVVQPVEEEVQVPEGVAQLLPAVTSVREARHSEEAASPWEAAEEVQFEPQASAEPADEPPASVEAPLGPSYTAAAVVVAAVADTAQLPGCRCSEWGGEQELRPLGAAAAAAVCEDALLQSQSVPDCWSLDLSADAAAADVTPPVASAPAAFVAPTAATEVEEEVKEEEVEEEPSLVLLGDETPRDVALQLPLELRTGGFHSGGGGGGRNSTRSSGEVPPAPPPPPPPPPPPHPTTMCPTVIVITPEAPEPPRRPLAADSISGLTMTRLLIRQLGLVPAKLLKGEESPLAVVAVPPPPPPARTCTAADDVLQLTTPFAAAVGAAEAALHLTPAAAVVAAPSKCQVAAAGTVTHIEPGRSHESVSVTFALELPYGHAAAAAVAAGSPDADALEGVVEGVELPYLAEADAGAGGGCAAAADDDLSSSLVSTRESSAVFDERSSYDGAMSSRSMQGWLEPQGWKPLRERFGGGVGQ